MRSAHPRARALGLDAQVGSLEVGKRADLTAVSMHAAHLTPSGDPCAALVFAAHQTDVCLTVVDGIVRFDGHQVTSLDEPEARRQAHAVGSKLRAEPGPGEPFVPPRAK